jgi:ABC-type polysaccharide/polyol phosphate transport system ATPase subunit
MGLSLGFQRELNAIDNVKLSCAIMGMSPSTIEQVLPDVISFADLDPPSKVYESVHTYSSGMQARLAFSLALHTDAPTILIDEILGAGDLAFHAKCQAALRKLLTDKTLLLVSHSPEQIQSFCDRTIWLHHGWLHMDGPTQQVLTAYQEFVVKEAAHVQ